MPKALDKDPHEKQDADEKHQKKGFYAAILGSIGVVYGDIGTSPLYAFREALRPIAYDGVSLAARSLACDVPNDLVFDHHRSGL